MDGMNLYGYVRGNPIISTDGSGTKSGSLAPPPDHDLKEACEVATEACLNHDPMVNDLLDELRECWGMPDDWRPDIFNCETCSDSGQCGGYRAPWTPVVRLICQHQPELDICKYGRLHLCYNNCMDGIEDCSILRHELTHAVQYCHERHLGKALWDSWLSCLLREREAYCNQTITPTGDHGPCCDSDQDGSPDDVTECCNQVCGSCGDPETGLGCQFTCEWIFETPFL